MPFNLRNRSLLSLCHHTPEEITYLLDLAKDLKRAKRGGYEVPRLVGKNIALIFEKTSTRTRSAFEVAAADQGAHTSFFDPTASQFGHKESVKDSARVLGEMYDALEYRGFSQRTVEELDQYAGVPVFNGLTDEWHPTQMLCDLLTMREHAHKPLHQISFAYVGDARFNTGNSLLMVGAKMGMDVRIGAPKAYWPEQSILDMCEAFARESGAKITLTEDPEEAVKGVDFIYTDIWVSMGEPASLWEERIRLLSPYQVNAKVMAMAADNAIFLHCLPAFHDTDTSVAQDIEARFGLTEMEVTDEVFESAQSKVFDEAENRMHSIKAIVLATLG